MSPVQHEESVHCTPNAALPLVILYNPATLTLSFEDNSFKMAVCRVEILEDILCISHLQATSMGLFECGCCSFCAEVNSFRKEADLGRLFSGHCL